MATTGVNICKLVAAALVNGTVQAAGTLTTLHPTNAKQLELSGNVTRLDRAHFDLGQLILQSGDNGGFAKNGGLTVNLTGTTPVTLSLLDLTSNSTSSAGDTVFATWNVLVFKNTGAADVTIAPAGSNPASLGLAGTSPTLTVPAGSTVVLNSAAGITVDSTHKSITVTPTSGGSLALCVGGA